MIVVTTLVVFHMQQNIRLMEEVVTQNNVKVELARNMYVAARERSILLLRMMVIDDPFERDELFLEFTKYATRFGVARIAMMETHLDEHEKQLLETQNKITQVVAPQQRTVVDLMVNDEMDKARVLLLEEAIPGQNRVLSSLNKVLVYEKKKARDALNNANLAAEQTIQFIYILSTSVIFLKPGDRSIRSASYASGCCIACRSS
jgi:hypothetical protein